jgi:hypothetical protein
MRIAMVAVTIVAACGAAGCEALSIRAPDIPGARPEAVQPAQKEDFEGHYLTVWIDGAQTATLRKGASGQLWQVAVASPAPEIKFTCDAVHLGPLKKVEVTVNPWLGDKPNYSDVWKSDRQDQLKPGQAVKFDTFSHIAGGKLTQSDKLPAGTYAISVNVVGERTWDRQTIVTTVK